LNPLFLIAAALILLEQFQRAVAVLRIILVLMIPFCWVVFHCEALYPREGHFLWIFGMVLALFSGVKARGEGQRVTNPLD